MTHSWPFLIVCFLKCFYYIFLKMEDNCFIKLYSFPLYTNMN